MTKKEEIKIPLEIFELLEKSKLCPERAVELALYCLTHSDNQHTP